ncbi:MAG: hypothetical protein ACOCUI_02670 [bacterium]
MKFITKLKDWIKENWLSFVIFIVIYTFSIKFHVYYQILYILVLLNLFLTYKYYKQSKIWHEMEKQWHQIEEDWHKQEEEWYKNDSE